MNSVEVFIIDKDSGANIHKYSILGIEDEVKDELLSNFLTAINKITKEVGLPSVSMIRFGSVEARFYFGKKIYTVLFIDFGYLIPLESLTTEQILSGLPKEFTLEFEEKYRRELNIGTSYFDTDSFNEFRANIDKTFNRTGQIAYRYYIKAILAETTDAWSVELIKKLEKGISEKVLVEEIEEMIPKNQSLQKAIRRVNNNNAAIWEIFAIPTLQIPE